MLLESISSRFNVLWQIIRRDQKSHNIPMSEWIVDGKKKVLLFKGQNIDEIRRAGSTFKDPSLPAGRGMFATLHSHSTLRDYSTWSSCKVNYI